MAPTKEEERKIKEFKDESPFKLGPAEKFLRAVLDIPFAFKRIDAMLYIANFDSEVEYLKRSFETLQVNFAFSLTHACRHAYLARMVAFCVRLEYGIYINILLQNLFVYKANVGLTNSCSYKFLRWHNSHGITYSN